MKFNKPIIQISVATDAVSDSVYGLDSGGNLYRLDHSDKTWKIVTPNEKERK